jgi:hypothetical protein
VARIRLARTAGATLVLAAVIATVATVPASAQPHQVTVRVDDGTLYTVVIDVPPGTTVDQVVGFPGVPGVPIAIQPLPDAPPPAPPEPPADPPSSSPPPADPPPSGQPPAGEPAPPPPPQAPAEGDARLREPVDEVKEPRIWAQLESSGGGVVAKEQRRGRRAPLRNADGTPTSTNPGIVDVLPAASTASEVPSFIIQKFRVPPFLLPIYQAAGTEYGVRWEILAAINEIETDYGRNLRVSSAGAVGWMQFMPQTWRAYGTDGNEDGRKDPYNPVDAIFAAARYLEAAGYAEDPRRAIFAYNHADWYVDSVLLRARLIAGIPVDLIGSLTGLTEARFPVRGRATYADDVAEAELLERVRSGDNAARVIESNDARRSIAVFAARGARVVAVNDGVVRKMGRGPRLGRHVVLDDVYGNRYTYARLGRVARQLDVGDRVTGGAPIGRVGATVPGAAPHLDFSIRPAGRGGPRIDPKPILDGWKLLEATSIYRANGENVLRDGPTLGQILLLSKSLLEKRVLADTRIEIYECGRADIRAGRIDRRVLATLAYLSESGLRPTVTSLTCGHSHRTKSGSISHHSSGNAVDISKVNGVPVLGHQEPGGVVDQTVRRVMQLQGAFAPTQVISLFAIGGPTIAMADHADHIHVGFQPARGGNASERESVLKPYQWPQLLSRLREIPNPVVGRTPRQR